MTLDIMGVWVLEMNLRPAIEIAAKAESLDPNLVNAIVIVESSCDPSAIRYEQFYRYLFFPRECADKNGISFDTEVACQKMSWGLMQVMGAVAREYGFQGMFPDLCKVGIGLSYGCKLIHRLSEKYYQEEEVVSAYNAGCVVRTTGGMFTNQLYVDKVYRALRAFRALK